MPSRKCARSGVALVWVLLVLGVVAILAGILAVRSRQHVRLSAWYSDRVAVRLLADSAVEEMSLVLQEQASVREQLASAAPGTILRGVEPRRVLADVNAYRSSTVTGLTLQTEVTVISRDRVSYDEAESTGTVRIVARIRSRGSGRSLEELSWLVREFRSARVAFPSHLFPMQFFVSEPDADVFPGAGGQSICVAAEASPRTILDLMSRPASDGFRLADQETANAMAGYFRSEVMRRRATMIFRDAAAFHEYHASRVARGLPLDGVFHVDSEEPLGLAMDGFRGRAQLSSRGPIVVHDVRMARPGVDELVLVSGIRVVVQGRTVQASLVALSGDGVQLARPTHIEGRVLSRTFPTPIGMTAQELSDVRISTPAGTEGCEVFLDPSPLHLLHRDPSAVLSGES